MQQLLGPVLNQIPADKASYLTGRSFFPHLVTGPFQDGLSVAFWFALAACLVAALASAITGGVKPVRAGSGSGASVEHELPSPVGDEPVSAEDVVDSLRTATGTGGGTGGDN
jgi:hypothetical protein